MWKKRIWALIYGTSMIVVVGIAIRAAYHRFGEKRNEALTAAWNDEMDPVEIRIEMYGLGRYAGHHEDRSYAVLPLDLVDLLAEKFGIGNVDLIRPYIKGILDGQKERTDE